jgi:hypothetical protein
MTRGTVTDVSLRFADGMADDFEILCFSMEM